MSHDPILNAVSVFFRRLSLFVWHVVLLAAALWSWLILGWFDRPYTELWGYTKAAFAPSADPTPLPVLFWMCAVIAFLAVAVVFLLAALWWKRKGSIHHRGAKFVDARALGE